MSNGDDRLWQWVEAELDARRDPLADAALARALGREPEALAATRRLVRRLELLPEATLAAPRRDWRSRRAFAPSIALAGALLVFAGARLALDRTDPHRAGPDTGDRTTRAPAAASPLGARMSLVVVRTTEITEPERGRGERVLLEPRRVLAWQLEER